MKTTGIVLVIIGVLAFIGTTIMGNNVLGPLVWTIVGIFLIIRANHKKRYFEEQTQREDSIENEDKKIIHYKHYKYLVSMRIHYLVPILLISFISCQNQKSKDIQSMSQYFTQDSTLTFRIPKNMFLSKKDDSSMLFEKRDGNGFVHLMIEKNTNGSWDIKSYSNHITRNCLSDLTLVEYTDTLIAYEIHKGTIRIPAQMFSVHECYGYSIMLTTMGINLDTHKAIGSSICTSGDNESSTYSVYQGEYLDLQYPSNWEVDENVDLLTTDVWIRQEDKTFGLHIYRFENNSNFSFEESMEEIASSWREIATVDISYDTINNERWCKQDIIFYIEHEKIQQLSYYLKKDVYVYNIKFGNDAWSIENNIKMIDSIMSSVKIK